MGDGTRIHLWEDLWWGDQPLCSQFASLLRIVTVKNLTISLVLGSTNPFSWNLNFCRNLSNFEIGNLERLMPFLSHLHLFPSSPDIRAWFPFFFRFIYSKIVLLSLVQPY